jgi:hypothetical protein
LIGGSQPTLDTWKRKKHLAFVFIDPALQSPISTFGHNALVATDRTDGTLELDAVLLEFAAEGAINTRLAVKALTTGTTGRFTLQWFNNKQVEYNLRDRNLWIYPIPASVRAPFDFAAPLQIALVNPTTYRFARQNCADRIFELFSEKRISNRGTRYLAVPLDELREIVDAGWTLPPGECLSLASRCSRPLPGPEDTQLGALLLAMRRNLIQAAHSSEPNEVAAFRNAALVMAQQALTRRLASLPAEDSAEATPRGDGPGTGRNPVQLQRGPDLRFAFLNRSHAPMALTASWRAGAFDFIQSENEQFKSSALEVLSCKGLITENYASLQQLTLIRLDSLEAPTATDGGQVRWLEIGWNRFDAQQSRAGRIPGEAGVAFGSGFFWAFAQDMKVVGSLLPFGTLGLSWNANQQARGNSPSASLGLRGQLQINPGQTPRCKLSAEWRAIEWNAAYQSRFGILVVPWHLPGGTFSIEYSRTNGRFDELSVGFAIPLR